MTAFEFCKDNLALTLGALGGLGAAYLAYDKYRESSKWQKVGSVDKLIVYPLKSGRGNDVLSARFESMGMRAAVFRDRTFCVVKPVEDGKYRQLNVVDFPKLKHLGLVYHHGKVHLRAGLDDNYQDLAIEPEHLRHDPEREIEICILDFTAKTVFLGQKYDEFVSDFLTGDKNAFKIAFHYSDKPVRPVRPKYYRLWPETYLPGDLSTLNGTSCYSLMNMASLDDLNSKVDAPFNPERFRSNIYLKSDSGIAFEEDLWTGRIKVGEDVVLRFNKPNNRCPDTTLDPVTLVKHPEGEPLTTLRTYRLLDPTKSADAEKKRNGIGKSPLFCVNLAIDKTGFVEVGDAVYVEKK